MLYEYKAGDSITGETFARSTVATYYDSVGVVQTAAINVKRDSHYVGGSRTLLTEHAATNVVLYNRDLTNAAWVKSGLTATKDQTGADGVASSATRLTATAANATALQSITLASSARIQSAFVKRITGSGTVEMTTNGGTTWSAVTVTGSWARVWLAIATLANPSVGFRIVTSGDEIAVDFVQNEDSVGTDAPLPSMPIETTSVSVARSYDEITHPFPAGVVSLTAYHKLYLYGRQGHQSLVIGQEAVGNAGYTVFDVPGDSAYAQVGSSSGTVFSQFGSGGGVAGDTIEYLTILNSDGSILLRASVNGGATVSAATSAATGAIGSSWRANTINIGGAPTAVGGNGWKFGVATHVVRVDTGVKTMAEMQYPSQPLPSPVGLFDREAVLGALMDDAGFA